MQSSAVALVTENTIAAACLLLNVLRHSVAGCELTQPGGRRCRGVRDCREEDVAEMDLTFFDVNVAIGEPTVRQAWDSLVRGDDLVGLMRSSGIEKAVAWHLAQREASPLLGNDLLNREIAGHPSVMGCWTMLPPLTDGLVTPDFFGRMKTSQIVALRAMPSAHRYLLNRVVFGRFLDEVGERRIPVILSLEHGSDWPAVYGALRDYPDLTCILADVGSWSQDRYTYPLLDTYENLCVETSMLSLEDGGVEAMAARFGAERILFGSGMPGRYAEAAMLQLTHAVIPDEDKQKIASGNLERLLAKEDLS